MQPFLKVLVLFGALASYEAATVCRDPIGVGDSSKISDQSFTATSSDGNHLPHLARYNNVNKDAWCAAKIGDSITVQLGKLYRINRVTVEGLQTGNGSYITSYKLKYSYHGAIFDYLVPLKGPQSKDDLKVEDLLQDIVIADAVTLIPQTFKNKPCLRFELFGCGYVEPPTPPPVVPTTKFDACKVKNGGCEHNCDTVLSKAVCSCRSGFILDADKQSCNVDHCMKNNGGCQDTCTSSKTGPVCGCNAGYKLDASKKNCTDINECLRGTDSCNKDKSACFNTEGSYTCICKRGYKPSGHGSKVCVDINECSSTGFAKNGNCSQECKNIDGAYRCACHDGYFLNRDGRTCDDIDECAQKTDVCVKRKSVCHNTPGSYQCICKPGFEPKSPGSRVCVDIDECSMTKFPVNGNCSQICENFQGFHRCKCHDGYFLERDGRTCTDIDECKTKNPCNTTLSTCINEVPGYHCKCGDGLVNKPGDKDKCIDKDECAFNKGGCDHNCHNTYRSYYCSCRAHYYLGDDHKTCHDVDECAVNNGGCQQICNNFDGGYSCQCNAGYTLATKDYKTCDDIDECQDGFNGGCQKYCNNTIGSYHCYCDPGFKVVNGKQCEDIDECAIGTHKCNTATSICKNLRTGSYRCDCLAGFTKNAQTGACEASSCASASPQPINGYAEPARCATPGGNIFRQTCTFKCNQGYQLTSSSAIGAFCDNSGYWTMTQGKDSPRCEPIRCNPLTPVANAFLSPPECATKGAQYTNKCLMYCQKNSANLVGKRFVTCQIDGTYDGDFSTTKCVQRPRISCPADIEEVLPLGQSSMKIEIGKINTNVAAKYLTSLPAGVLTGTYRFKHGYNSVRLIAKNELGEQDQCSFVVQIRDKEPPKVFDCDSDNQHININGKQDVVTWKEPRFTDNSGLLAKPVPSIKNGEQRAAQIYYVSYTAQDIAGNRASCNFFVHVHEKFCDTTLRHNRQIFPFGGSSYMIICGAKRFTKPVIGANVPNFARVQCSKGVWTPAELPGCTNFQTKTGDCPAGTQAVKISIHEYCSNCPAGKYNDVASGTCKNCEIGKYQDKEGQQSCNSCPQYSTTRFQGSTSKSDCKVLCDKGSYSKDGMRDLTTGCQKCPYGSFQDLNGKTECKICPEGGNTTASGSTDVSQCHAAAMITKVVPTEEVYNGFVGDNVTIECYAKGSPVPYLTINSKTTLAPANERGTQSQMPLPTNSKYVTGRKLSIINAQVKDTATYACVAKNQKGSGMAVDTRLIRVAIEQRAPASV